MGLLSDILEPITGAGEAADAQREGAREAAAATERSTERIIDFNEWLWGEQRELAQPFVDAGVNALGQAEEQIGQPFTAEDMMQDPGYQFRLDEGLKGIENSAAARGMQLSGRTLKGIGRYAQDYASGEFQNAYNRRQQGISNLMNLAYMGQASATGQAAQGSAVGGNITQAIGQSGAAQSQMHSNIGNINAAQAQSGFNTLMDIGGIAALTYGGPGWGA